jgi:hypothetical protein
MKTKTMTTLHLKKTMCRSPLRSHNPDAHRTARLQDLWFGIGAARKGWLTKEDVVNCLPLVKIERALRLKRGK